MTISEAYIKLFTEDYLGYYSRRALDVDGLFVFFPEIIPDKQPKNIQLSGSLFPAVDKKTGKIVDFSMLDHDINNAKVIQFKFK